MPMNVTQAKVKIDDKLCAKFEFNAEVKEVDGLSAVLFRVALYSTIKDTDQGGTIYTKLGELCAYADDTIIIATCREKIIEIYKEMGEKARKLGLEVNKRKTKYMIISTSESRRKLQDLKIEGKLFSGVSSFKYLGM
jgi:hypothetical protein